MRTSARVRATHALLSDLCPVDTMRALAHLVELGFIVAAAPDGDVAVYRLNAKAVRTEGGEPQRRILLIEDSVLVQDLMTLVLEEEGYALSVARAPAEAQALLREVAFDLVITDGFNRAAGAVIANTAEVLTAAAATPVALFTGHRIELDAAHAAGFRGLLTKPFEIDTLQRQVRALLH